MTIDGLSEELATFGEAELIGTLPSHQGSVLTEMLHSGLPPRDAAQLWLENTGQSNTAPFGAVRDTGDRLAQNLSREMQKLLCGSDEYAAERDEIKRSIGTGKIFVSGTIATMLAPHIGIAASVVAPAVVLILIVVLRAGNQTICETLGQLIDGTAGS